MKVVKAPRQPGNPAGNALKQGISEDDLLRAVVRSGYPLQTIIGARLLRRSYGLEEEWAYIDTDSEEARTLDLHASRPLQTEYTESDKRRRLRSTLSLLIECKQAELPYVAFESVRPARSEGFPPIAGLPASFVRVTGDDDHRYRRVGIARALGLTRHRFMRTPPIASSLSGVERAGKKLQLSGDVPYRSLILPLTKAESYYRGYWQGVARPAEGGTWTARLTVPIAVIDAPLVLARTPEEQPAVSLVPWVRVIRRYAKATRDTRNPQLPSMVDVVHKEFFDEYLSSYLNPYALLFKKRLREKQPVVLAGTGRVAAYDVDAPPPRDLYSRLEANDQRW